MRTLIAILLKIFGSLIFTATLFSLATLPTLASEAEAIQAGHGGIPHFALMLLGLTAILITAKMFHLVDRIKQPMVVGELLGGIFLGNLALVGIPFFSNLVTNEIVIFLAEFGVMLLLFQIGLESNIQDLRKAGLTSFLVAIVGVVVPVLLGTFVVGPLFLSDQPFAAHLFLGASLAATSVGITARVFKEKKMIKTPAASIVIGAAVIDDVMGLILLAIVSSLAVGGEVSAATAGILTLKAVGFLGLAILIGNLAAPRIARLFAKISSANGTKFTVAICFAMVMAALAQIIGLEPIIGAFAAGLVLDPVHFKFFSHPEIVPRMKEALTDVPEEKKAPALEAIDEYAVHNIEEVIETFALFFVPIFFVVTGMGVKLDTLFSVQSILIALFVSVLAILGKFVSGLVVKGSDKWIVGLAMVPRGEVGLIFAAVGKSLGVVDDQLYSIIILTVLITTIVGPGLLSMAINRRSGTQSKSPTGAFHFSAFLRRRPAGSQLGG